VLQTSASKNHQKPMVLAKKLAPEGAYGYCVAALLISRPLEWGLP